MNRTVAMLACALLGSLPGSARGTAPGAIPTASSALSPAAFQERHGIRLDQVAVTASGGLVDLRFTVLDPVKARALLAGHDGHAGAPRLLDPRTGQALEAPHGAMRNVRLKQDAACFLIYPNVRGAVRTGTKVSVLFGDVRVGPVAAK